MLLYDINNNVNAYEKDENLNVLVTFLENEKLSDIVYYEAPLNWITTAIICTATSSRHIAGVVDKLRHFKLKKNKMSIEGEPESGWVIAGSDGYFIYLFTQEIREYYTLDQLWEKAKNNILDEANKQIFN